MSGMMLKGERTLKELPSHNIAIIGDSRIGKSTLFNYLNGVRLEAKVNDEDGDYVLAKVSQNEGGADTAKQYDSVTLIPNVERLEFMGDTLGLIDTAGFEDAGRGYVGVFGVSFLLHELLERSKSIKFIFVLSQSAIIQ